MAFDSFGIRVGGAVLALSALFFGCGSVGPGKVPVDRANYSVSITESWKQQVLLNIVRIRYVEPLLFVDIGDIVAGYTVETGANVGLGRSIFDLSSVGDSSTLDLGVSGKFIDRPTITYKPMTGASFRKAIMSPLPLRSVALAIESGVSAQFLMNLGVRSMNGLHNAVLGPNEHLEADTRFARAVEILARLQLLNAVQVRVPASRSGTEGPILVGFGALVASAEAVSLVAELKGLLTLDPGLEEYALTNDGLASDGGRIVLRTFSLMQIMAAVADRVEIPEADVASRKALPCLGSSAANAVLGSVAVRSGAKPPAEAFAAIRLRNHWFWVDDHDLATKRVFSFLLLALTMMEESGSAMPMQMTIPVQ